MQAKGPGPMPANSTMRTPVSGPLARCVEASVCEAVMVSDGRTLYLVVVDGRQSGYSEGMSTGELAAYMLELGCRQAINLDGGGSSIMLAADGKGGYRTLNDPSTKVDGKSVARPIPVGLAIRKK